MLSNCLWFCHDCKKGVIGPIWWYTSSETYCTSGDVESPKCRFCGKVAKPLRSNIENLVISLWLPEEVLDNMSDSERFVYTAKPHEIVARIDELESCLAVAEEAMIFWQDYLRDTDAATAEAGDRVDSIRNMLAAVEVQQSLCFYYGDNCDNTDMTTPTYCIFCGCVYCGAHWGDHWKGVVAKRFPRDMCGHCYNSDKVRNDFLKWAAENPEKAAQRRMESGDDLFLAWYEQECSGELECECPSCLEDEAAMMEMYANAKWIDF